MFRDKKKKIRTVALIMSCLLSMKANSQVRLIDHKATNETRQLAERLYNVAGKHILFGHQHATEYGRGWEGENGNSDVKSVTGSHPAVIGIDIMGLSGKSRTAIEKTKEKLKANVINTNTRGGITTIVWHFMNPVSEDGFQWKDGSSVAAVKEILPGKSFHRKYKEILDDVAEWANSLTDEKGKLIPVIFRPFHEMDGDWFWWGQAHCTPAEFKELWRFTVDYLQKEGNVHNFIYAFSPDNKYLTKEEYLERYPGNDWVDLLGTDNYGEMGRDGYHLESVVKKLKIVSDLAIENQKLAAFTETGLESLTNQSWWTDVLLKVVKDDQLRLSYVLVWRNDAKSKTHFYAPYPGHPSTDDFIKFYKDPFTLFEKDLWPSLETSTSADH